MTLLDFEVIHCPFHSILIASSEYSQLYPNVRSMKHYAVVLLLCSHSVMSDSLWPHELQLIRLLYAWDSPDKNTGVGCHFLLQGSSRPRDRTCIACKSPALQVDSLWATENNQVKKKKKIGWNITSFFFFFFSIVALQCSVSFCCTVKWISYMYTYIPSLLDLLPIVSW